MSHAGCAIRRVTPNVVGNTGTARIEIIGDNFDQQAEVHLIAPDGHEIDGDELRQDSGTLFATFDLVRPTPQWGCTT